MASMKEEIKSLKEALCKAICIINKNDLNEQIKD